MSKQNEILVTIEEFLKDRKGPDFQVSLESDLRKDLQADSVELMEDRISIFHLLLMYPQTVTAMRKMMHRFFRISECSHLLIHSHWIRHV